MKPASLKEILERLHMLRPMLGVDRGWEFEAKTAAGATLYAARFSSADDHLLLLPCTKGFDPLLAKELFKHIGDVAPDFFDAEPARIMKNFSMPGYAFDRVLLLGPLAPTQFEAANPELQEHAVIAFPAFACEFTGTEEAGMVRTLRKYFVDTLEWNRAPQPRLLMMHRNSATGSRSPGQKPTLARMDKCWRELESLNESADSFIEIENIAGRTVRFAKTGGLYEVQVSETAASVPPMDFLKAEEYIRHFLIHGF